MRPTSPSSFSDQPRDRVMVLCEQQKLAISYALRSTLLSNPSITIELVRSAARQESTQ